MLTVSLHGISIQAKRGLYAEEQKLYNSFEVDVDIHVPANSTQELAYIDYTIIRATVAKAFNRPHKLLENFIGDIHTMLKEQFNEAERIKVVIRKLQPPMEGEVKYAQVSYEG